MQDFLTKFARLSRLVLKRLPVKVSPFVRATHAFRTYQYKSMGFRHTVGYVV